MEKYPKLEVFWFYIYWFQTADIPRELGYAQILLFRTNMNSHHRKMEPPEAFQINLDLEDFNNH